MSENESESAVHAPPAISAAPEPPPTYAPPLPARRRGRVLPVVTGLILLLLCGAVAYLWTREQALEQALAALPAVSDAQLAAVTQRLDVLEKQAAQRGGGDQALTRRMDALSAQVTELAHRPAPAAAGGADIKALEQRVAALEQRPAAPPPPDLGPLNDKIAQLAAQAGAAQVAADAAKGAASTLASHVATLQDQLAAATQRAGALGQDAAKAQAKAAQAQLLAHAQVALAAGLPVGNIPGAPPALARFATAKPPTEASLRLAFPAAAAAAAKASEPSTSGLSLGQRMWQQARSLVLVKQGDKVLVGAPAAEVLGEAQARLDAGDLAGAVAQLGRLDARAAAAMAPWRQQAQTLLDARAALAQMARG